MTGERENASIADSAGAMVRSDLGRFRYGIKARLFAAFVGVASLTLAASVVAFFSYSYIARSLQHIEFEGIPAVDRAFTLARQTAELSAISSTLVAANDQRTLAALVARLRAKRAEIGLTLDGLSAAAAHEPMVDSIKRHVDDLEEKTDRLSLAIQFRLSASAERQRLASDAVAAHDALIALLAPMVDDAGFDLAIGLQSSDKFHDAAELEHLLKRLSDVDAPTYQNSHRSQR